MDVGAQGSLTLYKGDAMYHKMVADHQVSEYSVRTEAKARIVDEWKERPNKPDNHFFDCLVGCAAAASMRGITLEGSRRKPGSKPKQPLAPPVIQGRGGESFFINAR